MIHITIDTKLVSNQHMRGKLHTDYTYSEGIILDLRLWSYFDWPGKVETGVGSCKGTCTEKAGAVWSVFGWLSGYNQHGNRN